MTSALSLRKKFWRFENVQPTQPHCTSDDAERDDGEMRTYDQHSHTQDDDSFWCSEKMAFQTDESKHRRSSGRRRFIPLPLSHARRPLYIDSSFNFQKGVTIIASFLFLCLLQANHLVNRFLFNSPGEHDDEFFMSFNFLLRVDQPANLSLTGLSEGHDDGSCISSYTSQAFRQPIDRRICFVGHDEYSWIQLQNECSKQINWWIDPFVVFQRAWRRSYHIFQFLLWENRLAESFLFSFSGKHDCPAAVGTETPEGQGARQGNQKRSQVEQLVLRFAVIDCQTPKGWSCWDL